MALDDKDGCASCGGPTGEHYRITADDNELVTEAIYDAYQKIFFSCADGPSVRFLACLKLAVAKLDGLHESSQRTIETDPILRTQTNPT